MAVDIYNAFQQGREVGRRNAAYNALRTHYGDIAGDPEAASQLQQYEQRQALFPLQTEAARLSNETAATKLPFIQREAEADIASKQALAGLRGEQAEFYAPKAEADIAARMATAAYNQARAAGVPEELALKHAQAVQAQETARLRGVQADVLPGKTQAEVGALNALTGQRQVQTELAPGLAASLEAQRGASAGQAEANTERLNILNQSLDEHARANIGRVLAQSNAAAAQTELAKVNTERQRLGLPFIAPRMVAEIANLNARTESTQTQTELAPGLAEALRAQREAQAKAASQAREQPRYFPMPDGRIVRAVGGQASEVTLDGAPVIDYRPVQAGERISQGAQRLQQNAPEGKGAAAKAIEIGKEEGKREAADLPLSKTQLTQAKSFIAAAEQSFKLNDSEIEKALKDANWTNTGLASLTRIIPGTPAADFEARLNGIGSRVILDTLQELKRMAANGSTGFGQLVTREEEIMQSRYNDFRSATSGRAKKEALQTLRDQTKLTFERAKRAFNEDLAARGQGSPPPEAAAPSNLPSGWTYIGPVK